jgi:hypothetical protein
MKIKYLLPWTMLSFLALAELPMLQPQTQGEVSFVSGGVGGGEREAMHAIRQDYNLNLLFSEAGTGSYLSDVKVSIHDANGNSLLDTLANGPFFYAKLKPGRYTVSADHNSHTINKITKVGQQQRSALRFIWPQ